jgi:hypothetical protein
MKSTALASHPAAHFALIRSARKNAKNTLESGHKHFYFNYLSPKTLSLPPPLPPSQTKDLDNSTSKTKELRAQKTAKNSQKQPVFSQKQPNFGHFQPKLAARFSP